ncbi:MAG: hypothetical protein JPMHGGIA_01098 [Saprospiraceae bacterium]|jgi:glycosyltransferase involved in cell wall biosynthesis|nr:hypothetical protein [Saprospiraceae bacterium]
MLEVPCEIIVCDDGSGLEWQPLFQEAGRETFVRILDQPVNSGRAATRNRLAAQAQYPILLFLDADVYIAQPDFLHNYLRAIPPDDHWVIYGGCQYPEERPEDPRLRLHWEYGRRVENPGLAKRKRQAHRHFHTVNFMVPKALMLHLPFDEHLKGYGHEDSAWATALSQMGVPMAHIENPVVHLGLNTHVHFLRNVASSVSNALTLESKGQSLPGGLKFVRLCLGGLKLKGLCYHLYRRCERRIVHNLIGQNPNLWMLGMYKLGLSLRKEQRSALKRSKS